MRIDGEQETEGAADAMDVCGWLISLDLISMIVDPPDGVPHSIGLISRRNSAVSKMTPILGDFNEPPPQPTGTLRVLVRASKRLRTRPSIANGPGPPITRAARQAI